MTTRTVLWLVLDMDDGVLGAYPTRKAAVEEHAWGPVIERHAYGPGSYSYVTGWADDTFGFFVEREDVARRSGGWEDVVAAWEQAGRPTGRLTRCRGISYTEVVREREAQ